MRRSAVRIRYAPPPIILNVGGGRCGVQEWSGNAEARQRGSRSRGIRLLLPCEFQNMEFGTEVGRVREGPELAYQRGVGIAFHRPEPCLARADQPCPLVFKTSGRRAESHGILGK